MWGSIGVALSDAIRIQLIAPGCNLLADSGQLYNVIITAHGLAMIFFFVMPTFIGALANYLVPLMLGTADMANTTTNTYFPSWSNFSPSTLPYYSSRSLIPKGVVFPIPLGTPILSSYISRDTGTNNLLIEYLEIIGDGKEESTGTNNLLIEYKEIIGYRSRGVATIHTESHKVVCGGQKNQKWVLLFQLVNLASPLSPPILSITSTLPYNLFIYNKEIIGTLISPFSPTLLPSWYNFWCRSRGLATIHTKSHRVVCGGGRRDGHLLSNKKEGYTGREDEGTKIKGKKGNIGWGEEGIKSVGIDGNKIDGSYLAGLIEGDGYITINNKNKVSFGIIFHIKDLPLAQYLLSKIGQGFGYIVKRPTNNSIELRFTSKKSLVYIVSLINGHFRTPKIDLLHKLIDWLNLNHSTLIHKKGKSQVSLMSNAWLAGFIDADGGFYIKHTNIAVACKFAIEQRMIYPVTNESFVEIMGMIAESLKGVLGIRNRQLTNSSPPPLSRGRGAKPNYIMRIENQTNCQNLINYLDDFPLFSSRRLDYLCWKRAFSFVISKKHLTSHKPEILLLKNAMNNKRTEFNWDHLTFDFFVSPPHTPYVIPSPLIYSIKRL
jgi:hypothetical protein